MPAPPPPSESNGRHLRRLLLLNIVPYSLLADAVDDLPMYDAI